MKKILWIITCLVLSNLYGQKEPVNEQNKYERRTFDIGKMLLEPHLYPTDTTTSYTDELENSVLYIEDNEEVIVNRNTTSNNRSSNYSDDIPSNMLDKYTLSPSQGSLGSGLPSLSEDLYRGKVNIGIPLVEFKYFDFTIPISINNRYPQQIYSTAYKEPSFYLNSGNVGGDWTLSTGQYKVSRSVNGVEDEHPTKGYFTTTSQNKINNPSSISNGDVENGLKGNWDTGIDIFNFTTPTVSGSFIIDLAQNTYKILSGNNFHVEYSLLSNKLNQFIINDSQGNKYVFGGDNSTIEVSQSITDVFSYGTFKDVNYDKFQIKFLIHTIDEINSPPNKAISFKEYPNNANLFTLIRPSAWCGGCTNLTPYQVIDLINNNGNYVSNYIADQMVNLGNGVYGIVTGNTYGPILLNSSIADPEMKREKVNTAWYLNEIILLNQKKIQFSYSNSTWESFETFGSNKINVPLSSDFIYTYDDIEYPLNYLEFYPCFSEAFEVPKFPINESHSRTTHFVKKPKLQSIFDEDNFSRIDFISSDNVRAPYLRRPSYFSNSPSETISTGSNDYYLLAEINHYQGDKIDRISFVNHIDIGEIFLSGQNYDWPVRDRSYLDRVIINGKKEFSFEYESSTLKKIHYPTGGTKEFFKTSYKSHKFYSNKNWFFTSGDLYGSYDSAVEKIITTTENNITTESYSYPLASFNNGVFNTFKTFRPETVACTTEARLYSTSPVFNSHYASSGITFPSVKKHVNNQLQFEIDFNSGTYTPNSLNLTSGATYSFLSQVGRPSNYKDNLKGGIKKHDIYKTVNSIESITSTAENFNGYFPENLEYPSIYLTKIEAGPWGNTNGAILKGYSTYYYPLDYEVSSSFNLNTEYFDGINSTNQSFTYFKKTSIPQLGLNSYNVSSQESIDSEGSIIKTEYFTAADIENLVSTEANVTPQNTVFNKLLSNNINPVVETLAYKNNNIVGGSASQFGLSRPNSLGNQVPIITYQKNLEISNTSLNVTEFNKQHLNIANPQSIIFDSNLKDKVTFDEYDEYGHLLEYHAENGTYTSIIWGYNNQYPIAKIENIRYIQIESYVNNLQTLSNSDVSETDETALRVAVNSLRNEAVLNNSMTTSYTYDPIVGLSSTTDPKGYTTHYEYDNLGRLTRVLNSQLKIVEEYKYNYKDENLIVVPDPIVEVVCETYTISIIGRRDSDEFTYSYIGCSGNNVDVLGLFGELNGSQIFDVCVKSNTGGVTATGIATVSASSGSCSN